jgi:hypothetical protein
MVSQDTLSVNSASRRNRPQKGPGGEPECIHGPEKAVAGKLQPSPPASHRPEKGGLMSQAPGIVPREINKAGTPQKRGTGLIL